MRLNIKILSGVLMIPLLSCQSMPPEKERMEPVGHLSEPLPSVVEEKIDIPPVVTSIPTIAPPKPAEKLQTFTVVVADVPANELLFALARDARLNLDIDPGVNGRVSINAIDQTLPQILNRISRQIDLRYYMDGPNLVVEVDKPFTRVYRVDYLNMSRETTSNIDLATQISSTGGTDSGGGGNNSQTTITNTSTNNFWESLEGNLTAIISGTEGGQIISNRETGTLSIFASSKDHEKVQSFLDNVMNNARKQVLIEATVVEVTLNDQFQSGVDWSRVATGDGFSVAQSLLAGNLGAAPFLSATYTSTGADANVTATIKALDAFGEVSVMSSPKIMALNNQTSILKVVDNKVYFTTEVEEQEATTNAAAKTTFTTTINTVPVGFVMNVTPFITSTEEVILNIRPTISRILRFIEEPNPTLVAAGVTNQIPEIQVREMESVLRVNNGDTAIIGGLMQDSQDESDRGIPGLKDVDGFGLFFNQQERTLDKTELVIFLRPRVINSASVNEDLKDFQRFLTPRPSSNQ